LRKWFAHDPARWNEFQRRYRAELQRGAAAEEVQALAARTTAATVTLVYAARDVEHNSAVVLKRAIDQRPGKARRSPVIGKSRRRS
jgi:uncharacterized protein YeaO (DUF488 family)